MISKIASVLGHTCIFAFIAYFAGVAVLLAGFGAQWGIEMLGAERQHVVPVVKVAVTIAGGIIGVSILAVWIKHVIEILKDYRP